MKKWSTFAAGCLCSALLLSCTAGTLAASGTIHVNSVGLKANGKTLFSKDQELTNDAGRPIPSSILYEDEAGGGTTYLPLAYVARLLDTPVGWDQSSGTVLLGYSAQGGQGTVQGSLVDVSAEEDASSSLDKMATTAVGSEVAPFTEIAPRMPQGDEHSITAISPTKYQCVDGYEKVCTVNRDNGRYVSVTVKNNNDFPLLFRLGRSYNQGQQAVPTQIPAGQTVTRTVEIGESDLLISNPGLLVFVGSNGRWDEIDIEVEAVQFGQETDTFPWER